MLKSGGLKLAVTGGGAVEEILKVFLLVMNAGNTTARSKQN